MSTTRRPGSGAHGNDVEELRADIAEARSELGDTVQALAAKTDVKKQAKDAAGSAKAKVVDAAETARGRVSDAAATAQTRIQERAPKLAEAAGAAKAKIQEQTPKLAEAAGAAKARATVLADRAQANPKVRQAVTRVRQRPGQAAAIVGAVVLTYVIVRRRRSR